MKRTVRWTRNAACKEFPIAPNTLVKRLAAANIQAGPDGKYSTEQILSVLESKNPERDREARARARHWELRNETLRKKLLDRADVEHGFKQLFAVVEQILDSYPLSPRDKKDLRENINTWPTRIEAIANNMPSLVSDPEKEEVDDDEPEPVTAKSTQPVKPQAKEFVSE